MAVEVGVQWQLRMKVPYREEVREAIGEALKRFQDEVFANLRPGGAWVRYVPVYDPRYYPTVGWRWVNTPHYYGPVFIGPRPEGRTEQLRKSVFVLPEYRPLPAVRIGWRTPYVGHLIEKGKVRTPGTSTRFRQIIKRKARDLLFSLVTRELRRRNIVTGRTVSVPAGTVF